MTGDLRADLKACFTAGASAPAPSFDLTPKLLASIQIAKAFSERGLLVNFTTHPGRPTLISVTRKGLK